MTLDTSQLQRRALDLLKIPYALQISRESAIYLLEQAHVPGDGQPAGYTGPTARALSDDAYLAALRADPSWSAWVTRKEARTEGRKEAARGRERVTRARSYSARLLGAIATGEARIG